MFFELGIRKDCFAPRLAPPRIMEVLPAPAPAVATDVEANNAPLLEPSADRSEAQLLEQSTHQHCSNKWLSKLDDQVY